MTTYNGKRAGYIPGERPVNKEPPVAKYVVEKLYKVHRERLIRVQSLTDNHLHVMDFLTDKTWKKTAAYHQELRIMKHNEEMYERIAKVENGESIIAKEKREHVKKVSEGAKVMDRLKKCDRERKLLVIQKENEHLHARLQKASAEYTQKKCNDWYKHHELFKKGRRTDVTAGHIMNVPRNLLPRSLPSLNRDLNSELSSFNNNNNNNNTELSSTFGDSTINNTNNNSISNSTYKKSLLLKKSLSANNTLASLTSNSNHLFDDGSIFIDVPSGTFTNPIESKRYRNLTTNNNINNNNINDTNMLQTLKKNSKPGTPNNNLNNLNFDMGLDNYDLNSNSNNNSYNVYSNNNNNNNNHNKERNLLNQVIIGSISNDLYDDDNCSVNSFGSKPSNTKMVDDLSYYMIAQRQFAIPFEQKNCIIQIFVAEGYDENFYFRVISVSEPYTILSNRCVSIDQFFDVTYQLNNMPQAASMIENVSHLRSLLTNMFHEADSDDSGTLSFDEFHALMEKIDLGITSQELRFVISEADENADGVVDYEEFVPIAVDMILAFRARTAARKQITETEGSIDEAIHKALHSGDEIDRIAQICLSKLLTADPKRTGVMRVNDLRRTLQSIAGVGLSPVEINMICQSLPRDQLQRCQYETFRDVLYDVRFISMKNLIMESKGTYFQNHLLDLCKQEEQKIREEVGDDVAIPGMIPFRNIVNMLIKSQVLTLNRLQVMVIVSEAHVVNEMVNYHTFVPTAAKAIEMMFEPNSVRVRSELLENTDLSVSQLLEGESSEEFHNRLVSLFNMYDIKHTGELDPKQFNSCMQSLELNLTPSEIFALMASADVDHSGTVSFDEFVSFCTHNLLHLEKEKRLRQLQSSEGGRKTQSPDSTNKTTNKMFDDMFQGHLLAVFSAADKDSNGVLDAEEIHGLLASLDINLTQFQLDVLISEMDANDDNRITYAEFVPVCAELLQSFHTRSSGNVTAADERVLGKQAMNLVLGEKFELELISNYIYDKVMLILETVENVIARRTSIKAILHNPLIGLCKSEANMLLAKLSPSEKLVEMSFLGKFKKELDEERSSSPIGTSPQRKNRRANTFKAMNEELSILIRRVRETTIKRSLLEPIDSIKLDKKLLGLFVQEARKIETSDGSTSTTLPVSICFRILSTESSLRLTIYQIIHIIQFATCFEIGTTSINYQQFSEFAAEKIRFLTNATTREYRCSIVDHLNATPLQFLNGLTEEELNNYLILKFDQISNEFGRLTEPQFCEILSCIPKVNFNDAEVLAISAAFTALSNQEHDSINCNEFLPWSYAIILMTCRERVIGRRLLFMTTVNSTKEIQEKYLLSLKNKKIILPTSETNEIKKYNINNKESIYIPLDKSIPLVKDIDRILDMTRLILLGEKIVLLLPNEKNKKIGNDIYANINLRSSTMGKSDNNGSISISKNKQFSRQSSKLQHNEIVANELQLLKCGKFIPIKGKPKLINLVNVAPGISTDNSKSIFYLPSLMTIYIECTSDKNISTSSNDKSLMVHIYSSYNGNDVNLKLPMPVKLPSIGLVDSESATQFANNLADLLVIDFTKEKDPFIIVS